MHHLHAKTLHHLREQQRPILAAGDHQISMQGAQGRRLPGSDVLTMAKVGQPRARPPAAVAHAAPPSPALSRLTAPKGWPGCL